MRGGCQPPSMCGRFSLFAPAEDIEERFGATFDYPHERRYNAAPGQALPVVTDETPERIQAAEWGLIPTWADDDGHAPINARAETLAEKPSFRDAVAGVETAGESADPGEAAGRCLVLSDGFYEWGQDADGERRPYRITRVDDEPFAMAGLWTRWRPPGTQTDLGEFAGDGPTAEPSLRTTFTVVTTEANDAVGRIHDRMPVILARADERRWLSADRANAGHLLVPCPAADLRVYPVSRKVNDPSNDVPSVVQEVDAPG